MPPPLISTASCHPSASSHASSPSAPSSPAADVLHAASRLEIPALLELGADLLLSTLDAASCVATWEAAAALGRPELQHVVIGCEKFALIRFEHVSEAGGFGALSLERLCSLVESSKLRATEAVVWRAVQLWLATSRESASLVESTRLALLRRVRY